MPTPFFGRERELSWLRSMFDQAATRGSDGKFGGPRMAVVLAETGYGKSRLVQELYRQLTEDPTWDPPERDYWPAAFGDIGAQLRVNPDMKGHVAKGPPRFLWIGARWQPVDDKQRNVDMRTALPDLCSEFGVHVSILERNKDVWTAALAKAKQVGKQAPSELLSQAADAAMPLGGLLLRLAGAAKDALRERKDRSRSHDEESEAKVQDIVDELMEKCEGTFEGRAATPAVFWLDDAQWIDPQTLKWLARLWRRATDRRWPVLVVATHWEREWRELRRKPEAERAATLCGFEGQSGVSLLELGKADDAALRACMLQQLPGLTASQQAQLIAKASGNFLSMVENLGDLRNEPMNFVDGDIAKALAPEGEDFVASFESDRQKRVEQRFKALEPKVRNLLGWSSRLGVRFLHRVVTEFAAKAASTPDANDLLDWCVDPGVILGAPSKLTREFRDKAFHYVAERHFAAYGKRHEAALTDVLRKELAGWINRSFGEDGNMLDQEEGHFIPEDSAVTMLEAGQRSELRDLLDLATRALPLPQVANWENNDHVAALRAMRLSLRNDAEENLWDRVRATGEWLRAVEWQRVPEAVLGLGGRGGMADHLQTAGLPQIAMSLRADRMERLKQCELLDAKQKCELWEAMTDFGRSAWELGKLEEAFRAQQEGLVIARVLAEELHTPRSRRDVAISLNNVAGIEEARGDLVSALSKYEEMAAALHQLAEELGTPASRRAVSVSLDNVAGIEQARGDLDAALSRYEESLSIRRALADELGTPQSRRDVLFSLHTVANIDKARGNLDAAFAKYEESLAIARALADEVGTPQSRRDLSISLKNVAGIEQARGDLGAALSKYEDSLSTARALAEELGTPQSRRDVSVSLEKVAGIEESRGDLDAALSKYEESLSIARALADELATPESRRDVSVALHNVAGIKQAQGDLVSALSKYEESLSIARALADELATPESRRDVSVMLHNVAGIEQARGDLDAALSKDEESLSIARALADELKTPQSRRDVSVSLDNVAGIEENRGDLDAALSKHQESLTIRRSLADELGTPESRRDVSISLDNVAGIEQARGELDAALSKYEESLSICRALADEVNTPRSLRDLAQSLVNVANVEVALGNTASALGRYEEALALWREICSAGPQDDPAQSSLEESLRNFRDLCSELGRHQDAIDAGDELLHVLRAQCGPGHHAAQEWFLAQICRQIEVLQVAERIEDIPLHVADAHRIAQDLESVFDDPATDREAHRMDATTLSRCAKAWDLAGEVAEQEADAARCAEHASTLRVRSARLAADAHDMRSAPLQAALSQIAVEHAHDRQVPLQAVSFALPEDVSEDQIEQVFSALEEMGYELIDDEEGDAT